MNSRVEHRCPEFHPAWFGSEDLLWVGSGSQATIESITQSQDRLAWRMFLFPPGIGWIQWHPGCAAIPALTLELFLDEGNVDLSDLIPDRSEITQGSFHAPEHDIQPTLVNIELDHRRVPIQGMNGFVTVAAGAS